MLSNGGDLPDKVEIEVGALILQLREAGWVVSTSRYDAKVFGNWYVELHRADRMIRLVKDRSQYLIDGSHMEEIKAAGLWRVFDDLEEFWRAVSKWITHLDVSFGERGPLNSI